MAPGPGQPIFCCLPACACPCRVVPRWPLGTAWEPLGPTDGNILSPLKQGELNSYFQGGLNGLSLTSLWNAGAWTRPWNAILSLSVGHTCTFWKKISVRIVRFQRCTRRKPCGNDAVSCKHYKILHLLLLLYRRSSPFTLSKGGGVEQPGRVRGCRSPCPLQRSLEVSGQWARGKEARHLL